MKVWVTKFALTKGVEEKEVSEFGRNMVTAGTFEHYHGEGRDWHKTLEAANRRAEEMRIKRIGSLKKQLGALEVLKFI